MSNKTNFLFFKKYHINGMHCFLFTQLNLSFSVGYALCILGKCLRSLYFESLHLLPLVSGKVPDLLKSGKIICLPAFSFFAGCKVLTSICLAIRYKPEDEIFLLRLPVCVLTFECTSVVLDRASCRKSMAVNKKPSNILEKKPW